MGFSFAHLVVVLIVIFVLFGAGKLPKVMGDLGKGIKNFRDALKGEDENKEEPKKLENNNTSSKE